MNLELCYELLQIIKKVICIINVLKLYLIIVHNNSFYKF